MDEESLAVWKQMQQENQEQETPWFSTIHEEVQHLTGQEIDKKQFKEFLKQKDNGICEFLRQLWDAWLEEQQEVQND